MPVSVAYGGRGKRDYLPPVFLEVWGLPPENLTYFMSFLILKVVMTFPSEYSHRHPVYVRKDDP